MQLRLTEKAVAGLALPEGRAQIVAWDTELRGFGIVVGKRAMTFVAEGRVEGRKRRVSIARRGEPRPDGGRWNVAAARRRARELLGAMAGGVDPGRQRRATRARQGLTLREALAIHVADMKKRGCSPRSIDTIEAEIPKYCAAWLDRPLARLTGLDVNGLHESLSRAGKKYLANRVVAEISAIWNSADRLHEFPGRNPASRVRRNKIPPKRERIDDADLPSWHATIQELPTMRRDLYELILFTGLRSADARSIRWEDVDLDLGVLNRPAPKGGEAKAFELPIPATVAKILKRRRAENRLAFADLGGDNGFAFPARTRAKPFRVIAMTQPKSDDVPSPHVLRRTYASVASDIGVPEIDRHVLLNHSFADKRVSDGYVRQSWDRLVEAQAAIEAALWARISPKKTGRARRSQKR